MGLTMTDAPWPRRLEAWEPELRLFSRELVGHIASLSERIANALGTLRVSAERRSDEPNGYSALSRRGPYERLLISEWALQLEHEDEFIRRASSGEHLFVELERRSPAVELEAWVLLDSGPSQLGAPRIAQLAALVAFTRRAREAGVTLHWAPLWNWEQPAHQTIDAATVQAWFAARTATEPTDAVLAQWEALWPSRDGLEREVWVVGDERTTQLARARGWSALCIDDTSDDGLTSLELRVTPARKRRTTTLRLPLPDVPTQLRLLRDPFDWSRPSPKSVPTKPKGNLPVIALQPLTELAFSHDSHRLLARTENGSVVAIPVRNSGRAGYGWPTVARLPPDTSLIASVWSSRRARGLLVAHKNGAVHGADWDGRLGVQVSGMVQHPQPHELFIATWPFRLGWEQRGAWFDAANTGRLEADVLYARAFGSCVARVMQGPRLEARLAGAVRTLWVTSKPQKIWLSWEGGMAAACQYEDRIDVHSLEGETVTVRSLPRALFAHDLVRAVVMGPMRGELALIAVSDDRRAIRALSVQNVAPQWREVVRARAPIVSLACSSYGHHLAWSDIQGEVAVYSRDRAEVTLRLHASNISLERP